MAARRRPPREPRDDIEAASPTQQDEADILREAGAETDEETGETIVDEERVLELGALDAASVIENRRNANLVGKKRANVKGVSFNTGDALTTYNNVVKSWPPNTIDIQVKRLTGVPVQHTITSRPRSGTELYDAVKLIHGSHDEAEYEIRCVDSVGKTFRCTSRMWMPDTRPQQGQQGQQGQQMAHYPPPQPPPGYPHLGYPPPVPPPPPPVVPIPAPGAPDLNSVVSVFAQMLEMTRQVNPPSVPGPQQPDMQTMLLAFKQLLDGSGAQQAPAPPPVPQPSPGANPPPGMTWVPQFNTFVPIDALARALNPLPEPPPPPPQPVAAPAVEAPPGHVWIDQLKTFVPIEALARALSPEPPPRPEPRPQYRPPPDDQHSPYRPAYGQGERPLRPPPYGGYQQPQRQQTPTDQLKEAMGTLRAAAGMIKEFNSIIPNESGGGGYDEPPPERGIVSSNDEDSPVRIIDTGHGKLAMGKDGRFRLSESLFANFDNILKFIGDQGEAIQRRAQQQRQAPPAPAPQRRLPSGYVEVGPGYQPPPGYRAVPVDPNDLPPSDELPPPPDPMPPPISGAPPPPPRMWSMPNVPDTGEG